jgi:hypothetical protein
MTNTPAPPPPAPRHAGGGQPPPRSPAFPRRPGTPSRRAAAPLLLCAAPTGRYLPPRRIPLALPRVHAPVPRRPHTWLPGGAGAARPRVPAVSRRAPVARRRRHGATAGPRRVRSGPARPVAPPRGLSRAAAVGPRPEGRSRHSAARGGSRPRRAPRQPRVRPGAPDAPPGDPGPRRAVHGRRQRRRGPAELRLDGRALRRLLLPAAAGPHGPPGLRRPGDGHAPGRGVRAELLRPAARAGGPPLDLPSRPGPGPHQLAVADHRIRRHGAGPGPLRRPAGGGRTRRRGGGA